MLRMGGKENVLDVARRVCVLGTWEQAQSSVIVEGRNVLGIQ